MFGSNFVISIWPGEIMPKMCPSHGWKSLAEVAVMVFEIIVNNN